MSGWDAPTDIMMINFHKSNLLLSIFNFCIFFVNPNLKVQTASVNFCLSPVWQTAVHEQAAVCIYTVYWVFTDIQIMKSSFNNLECDYGLLDTESYI